MVSIYAHDLGFGGEAAEPTITANLNGFVTVSVGDREVVLLGTDWLGLIKHATDRAIAATASEDDPYRFLHWGEDDPIGSFDPGNICGAKGGDEDFGPGVFGCVREPHPSTWVHVDAADGLVSAVWMDI